MHVVTMLPRNITSHSFKQMLTIYTCIIVAFSSGYNKCTHCGCRRIRCWFIISRVICILVSFHCLFVFSYCWSYYIRRKLLSPCASIAFLVVPGLCNYFSIKFQSTPEVQQLDSGLASWYSWRIAPRWITRTDAEFQYVLHPGRICPDGAPILV